MSRKCFEEKHVDLLLIGKAGKRHYVLIKDFNTLMCDHTLHLRRKHFCHYCLQAFSTEEISKCHLKDCFKINDKQMINMPKKGQVFASFESILVSEKNGKQNSEVSHKQILKTCSLQIWL